jgi:hypothetical protein
MRILMIACLAAVLHCTPQQRAEIASDGLDVGICIAQAVAEGGIDDPSVILQRCGGSTLKIIEKVAEEWLARATPDGGVAMATPTPIHVKFETVRQRAQTMQQDAGGAK